MACSRHFLLCVVAFCAAISNSVLAHPGGHHSPTPSPIREPKDSWVWTPASASKPHDEPVEEPEDNWVWIPPSPSNPHQNALFHIVYPSTDFSYTENGGSRGWPATFSECAGSHQSPIDIRAANVPTKPMPVLKFKHYWDNANAAHMNNSGKRVDISLDGKERRPTLRGGPLTEKYEFVELHFHWGENDALGSEHTIDARKFPMEAHMVHFKKSYGNIKAATDHADGIAVVAFFFQVEKREISDFSELVADLPRINRASTTVTLSSANAAFHWLKKRIHGPYFTYHGSLTTPPCNEVVTWMVYQEPILISTRQMEEFRKLHSANGKKIKSNHRVLQANHHAHITHVL